MKKTFAFIMAIIFSFVFSISIFATESQTQYMPVDSKIVHFDDGSYIVETFRLFPQNNYSKSSQNTTQGTKSICYYTGDNELEWEYQLVGIFTFIPGVSSNCISATRNLFIHSDKWSFSNENTYHENNVAHGKGTFKKKVLFITIKTVDIDVYITCDTNGNLSD